MKGTRTTLSIHEFKEGVTGIYYGQLFYLMKEVKKISEFEDETRSEDQLYIPVLKKLFDSEITIHQGRYSDKGLRDYYCTSTEKWNNKFPKAK